MVPTEYEEQKALVQFLRLKGYKFFRVPNETYTKSMKQKAINKALGVSPGVPDLFVIVPDGMTSDALIAIEMKRTKGGSTTKNQKEWIVALNKAGIPTAVCKGFDEAKNFIEAIEQGVTRDWQSTAGVKKVKVSAERESDEF